MAKEFDIYLNNRLTQCDIIVYSIPYRDGLTVIDKLILESCIEECVLMKFIAVQTESNLVSRIDELLKVCCERLSLNIGIDAFAHFNVLYAARPEPTKIELSACDIKTLVTSFTEAVNAMQIAVAPLPAYISKSVGSGSSTIELGAQADEIKYSIEKSQSQIELDADIEKINMQSFLGMENAVPITSEVVNLCYRVTAAVDTAMAIVSAVLDTELHYSLGKGESAIALSADVSYGDTATKYLVIENTVSILADVAESVIRFMPPIESSMLLSVDAESILRRHRLLGEMDADSLAFYDDMTLEDIDFVILQ